MAIEIPIFSKLVNRSKVNTLEKRSSDGLSGSANWLFNALNGYLGIATKSGTNINQQTAMSIAAVKRCVQAISDGMIGLNLKVYREVNGVKQPASSYFASIVIDQPNEYQNKSEWLSWMVAVCELKGNSYSRILRNGKMLAAELHPLNSENTEPLILDGKLKYRTIWNGASVDLDSSEVIHFKNLCDQNPLKAVSPIRRHAEILGVNVSARDYAAGVYKNGVLKFILKSVGMIKEDQRNGLSQSLDDLINGKKGNIVLPDGVSMEKLALTLADAQFVQTMQMSREDIAQIFGVPMSLVQTGSAKATLEQEYQDFYSNTLMGKAIRYEQELTRKLVAEKDKGSIYFKFQFNSLLRATASDRAEFYNKGINNGWIRPNEARNLEDMDDYEGGDQLFVNANLMPVDMYKEWVGAKISAMESQQAKNNNPTGNNNNISN